MHANLAILCRTWVATSILHSKIDISQIKNLLEASSYHQVSHIQAHPRYIIDWHTNKEPTSNRRSSIESFSPQRGQVQDKLKTSPSPNFPTLSARHYTTLTSNNIASNLQTQTSSPQIANYKQVQQKIPTLNPTAKSFYPSSTTLEQLSQQSLKNQQYRNSLEIPCLSRTGKYPSPEAVLQPKEVSRRITLPPPTQRTLHPFLSLPVSAASSQLDNEDTWGHIMEGIDTSKTFE
jgi:hypothetical protein